MGFIFYRVLVFIYEVNLGEKLLLFFVFIDIKLFLFIKIRVYCFVIVSKEFCYNIFCVIDFEIKKNVFV